VLCQLAQGLSLICGFCSSSRTFAIGLPSDPSSWRRPCLRLVLLLVSITMNTIGSRTGDLHPISSRPCRAYTISLTRRSLAFGWFSAGGCLRGLLRRSTEINKNK
jgi:hypothetical protein